MFVLFDQCHHWCCCRLLFDLRCFLFAAGRHETVFRGHEFVPHNDAGDRSAACRAGLTRDLWRWLLVMHHLMSSSLTINQLSLNQLFTIINPGWRLIDQSVIREKMDCLDWNPNLRPEFGNPWVCRHGRLHGLCSRCRLGPTSRQPTSNSRWQAGWVWNSGVFVFFLNGGIAVDHLK